MLLEPSYRKKPKECFDQPNIYIQWLIWKLSLHLGAVHRHMYLLEQIFYNCPLFFCQVCYILFSPPRIQLHAVQSCFLMSINVCSKCHKMSANYSLGPLCTQRCFSSELKAGSGPQPHLLLLLSPVVPSSLSCPPVHVEWEQLGWQVGL